MGFFNRMRKLEAEKKGMDIDLGSGGVKPPWCPFLAAKHAMPVGGVLELPGGAKQVSLQVQIMPMPCWRENCMLWDAEARPPCCGLLSLMDAVLYEDEDDDKGGGEGVTSGKGS